MQVPAGTMQVASEYLASVGAEQSRQMATAMATYGATSSARTIISDGGLAGWTAMFVGVITAGFGIYRM